MLNHKKHGNRLEVCFSSSANVCLIAIRCSELTYVAISRRVKQLTASMLTGDSDFEDERGLKCS